MLLAILGAIAVLLTCVMFLSKQMMLGFPSAMFWAIMAGYCYDQSLVTWDLYYLTFFASMGMVIFCVLAMYGLRTKKEEIKEGDALIDEELDNEKYLDEKGGEGGEEPAEERSVRQRAGKRRTRGLLKRLRK